MKRVIAAVLVALMVGIFGVVVVGAEETMTETVTETVTETETEIETEIETETETETQIVPGIAETGGDRDTYEPESMAEELDSIVKEAVSYEDAVTKIAAVFGINEEDAEALLATLISYGDKVGGESEAWGLLKEDIQDNRHFWVVVILAVATVVAVVWCVVVFCFNVMPETRKTKKGVLAFKDGVKKIYEQDSQTLTNMATDISGMVKEVREKEYFLLDTVDKYQKEADTAKSALAKMTAECDKNARACYNSNIYMLDMFYTISKRMGMPISDHATIDLWYAKAKEQLNGILAAQDEKEVNAVGEIIGGNAHDEETE